MTANIIGVDPGETVGVAYWKFDTPSEIIAVQCRPDGVLSLVRPWTNESTLIVCERFVMGRNTIRKTRQQGTTDVIGMMRGLADDEMARFRLSSQSDAKHFATNERLKQLGWYTSSNRHAMDAVRHVLVAIAKEYPTVFQRLVAA